MQHRRLHLAFVFTALTAACGLITGLDSLEEKDGGVRAQDAADERAFEPDGAPLDGAGDASSTTTDATTRPDIAVPDGKALLFVVVSGAPGGHVTSYPFGSAIDCTSAGGASCYALYDAGQGLDLHAGAIDGGPTPAFAQWGGGCTASVTPDCALDLYKSVDVSARFE
jgi:hypothetical protein